ncbi:hypothetical protein [Cryobacterium sp. AP23]
MIAEVFAMSSITRVRYPLVDDGHGNLAPDRNNPDRLPIDGCAGQPGATDEVLVGRDATLIQHTIFAPPGVDVLATDDVEYRGTTYSVDGEPAANDNGLGFLDHTLILLKTWEG